MDRYVEGSARARIWYLFACAALVLAAVLLPQFEVLFPWPQDTGAQLQALTRLQLIMTLVSVTLFVGLALLVIFLARLSIRHGSWPPPEFPVPFRMRVVPITSPLKFWSFFAMLLGLLLLPVGAQVYFWYTLFKITQSLAHAT
jgi:hypothetical protein